MKNALLLAGAILSAFMVSNCVVRTIEPVFRPVRVVVPAARAGYVYVRPYQRWYNGRYIVVPGRWVASRAGFRYTRGSYVRVRRGNRFIRVWRPGTFVRRGVRVRRVVRPRVIVRPRVRVRPVVVRPRVRVRPVVVRPRVRVKPVRRVVVKRKVVVKPRKRVRKRRR